MESGWRVSAEWASSDGPLLRLVRPVECSFSHRGTSTAHPNALVFPPALSLPRSVEMPLPTGRPCRRFSAARAATLRGLLDCGPTRLSLSASRLPDKRCPKCSRGWLATALSPFSFPYAPPASDRGPDHRDHRTERYVESLTRTRRSKDPFARSQNCKSKPRGPPPPPPGTASPPSWRNVRYDSPICFVPHDTAGSQITLQVSGGPAAAPTPRTTGVLKRGAAGERGGGRKETIRRGARNSILSPPPHCVTAVAAD